MQRNVAIRIEDGQQDEADGAEQGEDQGQRHDDLLGLPGVLGQAPSMAQPSLGEEGGIEEHGDDAAAGDEQRLEIKGANVGDEAGGRVKYLVSSA